MLKDLTQDDWLAILDLPEDRIPQALILRGTRALKFYYETHQVHFENILEFRDPNTVVDDLFIGDLDGMSVAYASVYGAPMASELVHIFGVLETPLVVQTGCCGALADNIQTGDLFVATQAYCGEGASQYYKSDGKLVQASRDVLELPVFKRLDDMPLHWGCIYTSSALFAQGEREVEEWFQRGFGAVDMETASTFAVAEYFGMDRVSILYAFDHPRQKEHILLHDTEKDERRRRGNRRMMEVVLDVVKAYGSEKCG